jgi:hypothetical protein
MDRLFHDIRRLKSSGMYEISEQQLLRNARMSCHAHAATVKSPATEVSYK